MTPDTGTPAIIITLLMLSGTLMATTLFRTWTPPAGQHPPGRPTANSQDGGYRRAGHPRTVVIGSLCSIPCIRTM
jgi:hypothetical protein